ncbi:hypothetical protein D3C86_863790 [compost metagenome]
MAREPSAFWTLVETRTSSRKIVAVTPSRVLISSTISKRWLSRRETWTVPTTFPSRRSGTAARKPKPRDSEVALKARAFGVSTSGIRAASASPWAATKPAGMISKPETSWPSNARRVKSDQERSPTTGRPSRPTPVTIRPCASVMTALSTPASTRARRTCSLGFAARPSRPCKRVETCLSWPSRWSRPARRF